MDQFPVATPWPKFSAERRRDELLTRLPGILASLNGCLRTPEMRWPKRAELKQLDAAVEELCREHGREIHRADGRGIEWRDYEFVNGRRKALHLCLVLKGLLRRVEQVPERPLLYLTDRAEGTGEDARLAEEFIKLWPKLIDEAGKGTAVRAAVAWERFLPLFLKPGKFLPDLAANRGRAGTNLHGSSGMLCYTRYLELYQEDVRWHKVVGADASALSSWGRDVFPSQHPVFQPLWRIFRMPSRLLTSSLHWPDLAVEDRKERACAMARDRQARARAKKAAQNSVTAPGASPT